MVFARITLAMCVPYRRGEFSIFQGSSLTKKILSKIREGIKDFQKKFYKFFSHGKPGQKNVEKNSYQKNLFKKMLKKNSFQKNVVKKMLTRNCYQKILVKKNVV